MDGPSMERGHLQPVVIIIAKMSDEVREQQFLWASAVFFTEYNKIVAKMPVFAKRIKIFVVIVQKK